LGANLGDPVVSIRRAAELLDSGPNRVVEIAPLYGSRPLGPADQPDYVNTVVVLDAVTSAVGLHQRCVAIERAMGRVEVVRWGPRLIDIDILLYGSDSIATPSLTVPHAELPKRRFVLQPLADVAVDVVVPGRDQTVGALLRALTDDPEGLWPLSNPRLG